jgi:NAD(P)-dependent dehydrogenase (short-subunit alcohol dehydrogenase family)
MEIPRYFELKDKVVILTGGAGVICSKLAKAIGECGAKLAILDISTDAMNKLSKELDDKNIEHITIKTDVLNKKSIENASMKILKKFKKVDILINGAGGNHPDATTGVTLSFFDLKEEAIKFVFNLNFTGTFMASQVFGKIIAEQGEGVILNISSMNAFTPLTNIPAYSAAKAAVSNFTKWLAVHMSHNYSTKIRVNAIAPGFILTEQNRFLLTEKESGKLTDRGKTIIKHTPMGRFGEPEDLISTVLWLISPGSEFVHGAVIPIDGGFSAFSGV